MLRPCVSVGGHHDDDQGWTRSTESDSRCSVSVHKGPRACAHAKESPCPSPSGVCVPTVALLAILGLPRAHEYTWTPSGCSLIGLASERTDLRSHGASTLRRSRARTALRPKRYDTSQSTPCTSCCDGSSWHSKLLYLELVGLSMHPEGEQRRRLIRSGPLSVGPRPNQKLWFSVHSSATCNDTIKFRNAHAARARLGAHAACGG